MKKLAVSLALLAGCSHANVQRGISTAQTGMAVVDVGTDKLVSEYVEAVQELRAHCKGDAACEKKYKVTDEDVAKVTAVAEKLSISYDQAAEVLSVVAEAWGEILPVIEQAKGFQKAVR